MAKIVEQLLVFKVSKLVKDSADDSIETPTEEVKESILEAIQELLVDKSCIVEIIDEL